VSVRIAPSILAADFAALGDAARAVEAGGADQLHVDVMDGHFVPNLTMGPVVVSALKRVSGLPLDVHLMVESPDRYLEAFVRAGAAMITVHVEVAPHLHRTLAAIRTLGAQAGVALNPSTPADLIRDVVDDLDIVLVMSVNPGFSGQAFIPRSLEKVAEVRALLNGRKSRAAIGVDGGVDVSNAEALVSRGATTLVAGSSVFADADPAAAVRALRAAAEAHRPDARRLHSPVRARE
jgi:ribulose-phosphate 3-epimerase